MSTLMAPTFVPMTTPSNGRPSSRVRIDDRFVNEDKLDTRLSQIFGNQTGWSWSWRLGQYVIENPPFDLKQKHIAILEAL